MSSQSERTHLGLFIARDRAGRAYRLREYCESITVRTRAGKCEAITATLITTLDGQRVQCVRHPQYVIVNSGIELFAEG